MANKGFVVSEGVKCNIKALAKQAGHQNANQLYRALEREGVDTTYRSVKKWLDGHVPERTSNVADLARFFGVEIGEVIQLK